MCLIKESLNKPYKFTDFVNYVTVSEKDGTQRITIRTNPTAPNLPKGIYQLFLPRFGIVYLGLSVFEKNKETKSARHKGTNDRLYQHAQKLTGWMKGATCPQNWEEFRNDAFAYGYTAENILDNILVYFMDMSKYRDYSIDAWETLIYNSLASKGQCRCNTAKRAEEFNHDTQMFIMNQDYLLNATEHYIRLK